MIYLANLGKRRFLKELPFILLSLFIGKRKILKILFNLHKSIEDSIDYIAMIKEKDALHPKYRLTGYHAYFVERIKKNEQVLDIGCGIGAVAYSVVKGADAWVTGIDMNEESILRARLLWKHERLNFVCTNALNLEFRQYDVVVLSNVLEHIKDRISLLKLLKEKVRPSKILVRVPQYDRHWHVKMKEELGMDYRLDDTHYIEYTYSSFIRETTAAGWMVKTCEFHWGELWAELESTSN